MASRRAAAVARVLLDRYGRSCAAAGEPPRMATLLAEFPGIGPAGAGIFLREVQAVWPQVSPYLDQRVPAGAGQPGLPEDAGALADLAGPPGRLARPAAGLVRVSRNGRAASEIATAAET